jgi:hypothetical protein
MSQYVVTRTKGFPAGAAFSDCIRVKSVAGVLQLAGSTDVEYGTTTEQNFADAAFDSGFADVAINLRTGQGTEKMRASGAITIDNPVYADANGKVAASGTVLIGTALETVTADGDYIEVLRISEASSAAASGGTTASVFEVDSDSATPKIALASQTGGTGDFTTTLVPELALAGDNTIIVPEANGDVLVAAALAQTLTNKTLTAPVVTDSTEVVTATNVITAAETGKTFFLNSATEFVSTLPAPAAGLNYKFIVTAAPSGASYTVVTNASANVIKGNVVTSEDAAGDFETAGADTISFVDGQAVAGDMVEVHCDGTNWFAYGRSKVAAGITITTAS